MDGDSAIVDVVDATWFGLRPTALARPVADPERWSTWWPGLPLEVAELRRELGVRWRVPAFVPADGARMSGRAEVWLKAEDGGTVAYFILRLDPLPGEHLSQVSSRRLVRGYRLATKRAFWALADDLDRGRARRHVAAPRNGQR